MTSKEKFHAIKLLDFQSIIDPVCNLCPVAEDCSGCLSHHCPFSAQLLDVLDGVFLTETKLNEAINFAHSYEDYCSDLENDLHNPSRNVA